jgi:hypothetical protein
MKKTIRLGLNLMIAFFLISGRLTAQQNPELKREQKINQLEAARIAVITEKLGLTSEQAEKFWPVYNEFSRQRSALRKEYGEAKRAIDPNNPNPEQQQNLVNLGLAIRQKELDLEKDYSGRLMGLITAQQMIQLHAAEKDFQLMVLQQIQQRRTIQQRKENFRDRNQQLNRRIR